MSGPKAAVKPGKPAPATPPVVPRHLAIVMDGNGRWATARGLPRLSGHIKGADAVREAVKGAVQAGVEILTLYAFSTENWRRPAEEVNGLMALLDSYLKSETPNLEKEGLRFSLLGCRSGLPRKIVKALDEAETRTAGGRRLLLNLALNYGAREELVGAARELAREAAGGRLRPEEITEARFEACLYPGGRAPVDLLIRTAGERRISNFLLWQSAYAELLFLDVLWPDFTAETLRAALQDFARRRRTFGGLKRRR